MLAFVMVAHRPARPQLDRAAAAGADLRVADGDRLRLRGVDGAGRLLHLVGQAAVLVCRPGHPAVERLCLPQHRHHRRPDPRAARLPVRLGGAEEPRLRRRGSRARGRRLAAARDARRVAADDHAGAGVFRRAGVLPRLRGVRPGAGAGRPRRPSGAGHLSVQADQQARHAVLPPDGGGRGMPGGGHHAAGDAAALAAEVGQQVCLDQGQGLAPEAAAAGQMEMGGVCADRRLAACLP